MSVKASRGDQLSEDRTCYSRYGIHKGLAVTGLYALHSNDSMPLSISVGRCACSLVLSVWPSSGCDFRLAAANCVHMHEQVYTYCVTVCMCHMYRWCCMTAPLDACPLNKKQRKMCPKTVSHSSNCTYYCTYVLRMCVLHIIITLTRVLETTLADHNWTDGGVKSGVLTPIQGSSSVVMITKHGKAAYMCYIAGKQTERDKNKSFWWTGVVNERVVDWGQGAQPSHSPPQSIKLTCFLWHFHPIPFPPPLLPTIYHWWAPLDWGQNGWFDSSICPVVIS